MSEEIQKIIKIEQDIQDLKKAIVLLTQGITKLSDGLKRVQSQTPTVGPSTRGL